MTFIYVYHLCVKPVVDLSLIPGPPLAALNWLVAKHPALIQRSGNTFTISAKIKDRMEEFINTSFFEDLIWAVNNSDVCEVWLQGFPAPDSRPEWFTHCNRDFIIAFVDHLHNPAVTTLLIADVPLQHIHDTLIRFVKSPRSAGLHFLKLYGRCQPPDYWAQWMTASLLIVNRDLLRVTVCNCSAPLGAPCGCEVVPIFGHTSSTHVLWDNSQNTLVGFKAAVKFMLVCLVFMQQFVPRGVTRALATATEAAADVTQHVAPSFPRLPFEVMLKILSHLQISADQGTQTTDHVMNLFAPFNFSPAPMNQKTVLLLSPGTTVAQLVVSSPDPPLTVDQRSRIMKYALSKNGLRRMIAALRSGEGGPRYDRGANRIEFLKQLFRVPIAHLVGLHDPESDYDLDSGAHDDTVPLLHEATHAVDDVATDTLGDINFCKAQ